MMMMFLLQVTKERDIVGAQLVRRNDEVSLLYDKINIIQTALRSGNAQYQQRLEDIRLLKLELRNLRRTNNILTKKNDTSDDLRYDKQKRLLDVAKTCRSWLNANIYTRNKKFLTLIRRVNKAFRAHSRNVDV